MHYIQTSVTDFIAFTFDITLCCRIIHCDFKLDTEHRENNKGIVNNTTKGKCVCVCVGGNQGPPAYAFSRRISKH